MRPVRSSSRRAGGSATSAGTFTVVVPNPLGTATIRKIAPGYTHTCAILADDTVKCWGANEAGQLGDGSTDPRAGAVTVAGVANPIDIAVGISFSCGVFGAAPGALSGSVQCWGNGTSGQLGNGSDASSLTPVAASSISTASEVSARAHHACALLKSGQVRCWGAGGSGQLGNGGTSSSPVPVNVLTTGPDDYELVNAQTLEPASTKAFQVSAGDEHTCARVSISDGSAGLGVKCWGATNHGELGNGAALCQVNTICDPKNPNPVPQRVASMTNAARLAVGGHHSCVVLTSGQLRCWGQGDRGQLGNNSNLHSSSPVTVYSISGATMASAGAEFSCASDGGTLKCWGGNDAGQLGNGTATSSPFPVTATAVDAGSFEPTSLMGGHQSTCMKLVDDTAFCFP
jgi:alpha-tubulin suppressor-like RCC1 family protein